MGLFTLPSPSPLATSNTTPDQVTPRLNFYTGSPSFDDLLARYLGGATQAGQQNRNIEQASLGPLFGLGYNLTPVAGTSALLSGTTLINNLLNPGNLTAPAFAQSIAQAQRGTEQRAQGVEQELARLGLSGASGGRAQASAIRAGGEGLVAGLQAQERALMEQRQAQTIQQIMQLLGLTTDVAGIGTGLLQQRRAEDAQNEAARNQLIGDILGGVFAYAGAKG